MKSLCKKTLAVIISLLLLCPVFTTYAYTIDDTVKAATTIIGVNEGSYTSVNENDNGAASIGKLAWHATRALDLLKTIVNANPENAQSVLGQSLYNEILSESDWDTRTFNKTESSAVSKLLGTDEGINAQDELAYKNVKSYVVHAIALGITDGKAVVYFADLENQMGLAGAETVANAAIDLAGSAKKVTLDVMHQAAMSNSTAASSSTRRKTTYNSCKKLNLDNNYTEDKYCSGEYKITASLLRVRSGPDTSYPTSAENIPYGTTVTVTEISGEWGKVTYKGKTGWIYMLYTELVKKNEVTATILGDINANGAVDAADAREILRYTAKLSSLSDSQKKYADVNADGKISAQDARIALRVAAKLEKL